MPLPVHSQFPYRSADGRTVVRERRRPRPVRSLVVDGVVQGDDSALGVLMQSRLGLLPALIEARAGEALAIGVGTGITLGALSAALRPTRITAVERCPGVLEAAGLFRDHWARPIDRPPVTLIAAEGREYLAAADARLDLIACDLLSPGGAGGLFTRSFYRLCADHLAAGGITTQWLPLFQMPLEALRRVVRAFVEVFSEVGLWLAAFSTFKPVALLVGGERLQPLEEGQVQPALAAVPAAGLSAFGQVRGLFLLEGHSLRAFAGDAPAFDDGEVLVEEKAAREGLADGGRENVEVLLDCARECDETQRILFRASCADQDGNWAAALEGYRRVWQVWPDDPLVRLFAGEASASQLIAQALHLWGGEEVEAAERALRRAVAAAPGRADAHEYLAKLLTGLGRHQEALAEIDLALSLDPDDPDLKTGRDAILHNLSRAGAPPSPPRRRGR